METHEGFVKTLHCVRSVFWKGMRAQIKEFVRTCETCQTHTNTTEAPAGLLQPLPIPKQIWTDLSMDFITYLSPSQGKTIIFEVACPLSKFTHFIVLVF